MSMESVNQTIFGWLSAGGPSGDGLFWLAALAQWPLYGVPVVLAGLWGFGTRPEREAAVAAAVTACLALFMAYLASSFIDHPRPFMLGLTRNVLDHASDSSFPSDHATLMFALAASFMLRPGNRSLGICLAFVGLAVGWARIALGVHFPFDVVGAATIAAAAACIVAADPFRRPMALPMWVGEAVRDRLPWLPDRSGGRTSDRATDDAHSAR